MSMRQAASAAALSVLLLASCGTQEKTSTENGAVAAEVNTLENGGAPDPTQPGTSANGLVDPVPPPDAVSHPDGYLPPAPAEPDAPAANSSGPDASPPATEDEYMRNKQAGR